MYQESKLLKTIAGQVFTGGGQSLVKNKRGFTHADAPSPQTLSLREREQVIGEYMNRTTAGEGKRKVAFTLAETMIVLIVLGVIASITIPPLVRRQIEAANRAKIKKSMTVYDYVMNKMTVENNLKSDADITSYAGNALNNCAGSTNYFKKAQGSGCRFKTSDGVWWDISDILNPTISLNQDDLNNPNSKNTFKLLGHFGRAGELRVDDLAYEKNSGDLDAFQLKGLENLWNFVENKKEEKVSSYNKYKEGAYDTQCFTENKSCYIDDFMTKYYYDDDGNLFGIGHYEGYNDDYFGNVTFVEYIKDKNGNITGVNIHRANTYEVEVFNYGGNNYPYNQNYNEYEIVKDRLICYRNGECLFNEGKW